MVSILYDLEPICFIMFHMHCGFLLLVKVVYEDEIFWDLHFPKHIPQLDMIDSIEDVSIINEVRHCFWYSLFLFNDPVAIMLYVLWLSLKSV